MALTLSPQVFAITSKLIEEATGLHYDPKNADLLAERLARRASELEFDSLLDYYYFLRYDDGGPREFQILIEQLVVNETYFFREADQLRALVDLLLPAAFEGRPKLRLWCAACSTGEEPLTLAMMLDERGLLEKVDVVATDISARVLAKAQEGTYSGRSLRALPEKARLRHFEEAAGGALKVHERLVRHVRWQRLNLLDFSAIERLGVFDVILCRNAFIYFKDDTVVRLVSRLSDSLVSRGILLVGASESLLRYGTVFHCEEHSGSFFYRRAPP